MKKIKAVTAFLFALIIIIPILFFNFDENAVSEIDNRPLAPRPFSAEAQGSGELGSVDNYVSDRVGFRAEMINAYNVINDRLFGKLCHPIYLYGKEGYIFGGGVSVAQFYGEYQEVFADMVESIQRYCDERDTPFLFVFDPAKPAVLTEYLPDGLNYDRSWVDLFLADIYSRNINCLDNTPVLREKYEEGAAVFNRKYDAGHWNNMGAFYGTNAMLEELKKSVPGVHVNSYDELEISSGIAHTLPVSNFVVDEEIPMVNIPMELEDITSVYDDELYRDSDNTTFGYFKNKKRLEENGPRVLVFQGSYMNGYGKQYFKNSFGEYIYIHDYQNVINFPYYYNLFKPDAVIFEVGEYTFYDLYFDSARMKEIDYNPPLARAEEEASDEYEIKLKGDTLSISEGEAITDIFWPADETFDSVWILLDREYDMYKTDGGYVTSVNAESFRAYKDSMKIICSRGSELIKYS